MRGLACILLIFVTCRCEAINYFVNHGTGNDSNNGTSVGTPFLTIGKAATVVAAGDKVTVAPGFLYDERVTLTVNGTAANPIIWYGGNTATNRGWLLSGKIGYNYIYSFTMWHGDNSHNFDMVSANGATNCIIQNCSFVDSDAIGINSGSPANGTIANWIIRSNYFVKIGMAGGASTAGAIVLQIQGTNNLIEYNDISPGQDGIDFEGYHNIFRNNAEHGWNTSVLNPDPHVDFIQSASIDMPTFYNMFERNYCYSNTLGNSHGGIFSGSGQASATTQSNFVYRFNVVNVVWSYALIDDFFPQFHYYGNTVASNCIATAQSPGFVDISSFSTNSAAWNNIFYNCNQNLHNVYGPDGTTSGNFSADGDLIFQSGALGVTEPNSVSGDPGFSAYTANDLHLQVTSPAIGKAVGIANATALGTSSTSLPVSDAGAFSDGWGITTGDAIDFSGNKSIFITSINYQTKTLTLATACTWTNNAPIIISGMLDIGALPYKASYTITNLATFAGNNYSIALDTNLVRQVVFYENGIPQQPPVSAPPFNYTSSGGTVTATLFPLFASQTLGVAVNSFSSGAVPSRLTLGSGTMQINGTASSSNQ